MDLSKILKGDSDPNSPRQFTKKGRQVILQVKNAIQCQQVHYIDYDQPWHAYFLSSRHCPTTVLWQNGLLLWLHLSVSPNRVLNPYYKAVASLVQKYRVKSQNYFKKEPYTINVLFTLKQVN